MAIPAQALELENRSVGARGEPTLCAAYEILRDEWRRGDRDRELGLHLMFLSWYLLIEPPHLTGLDETRMSGEELVAMFNEVHECFAPAKQDDAEFLYVVGLMSLLAPWLLGEVTAWEALSRDYQVRYRRLEPNGLDPARFDGRGAYGDYFGGQARVADGF